MDLLLRCDLRGVWLFLKFGRSEEASKLRLRFGSEGCSGPQDRQRHD